MSKFARWISARMQCAPWGMSAEDALVVEVVSGLNSAATQVYAHAAVEPGTGRATSSARSAENGCSTQKRRRGSAEVDEPAAATPDTFAAALDPEPRREEPPRTPAMELWFICN
ncbi:hypothetical protein AAE478_009749 [Parahypoxylon ruwenzoriense]